MDLKHKHWALIFIGILVGILAIIVIWHLMGSGTAVDPGTDVATTTPQTAAAIPVHIIENATYYDIDLTYPSATPLLSVSPAANERAVTLMKETMQGIAAEFKKSGNFSNLSHDDVQMLGLDQRKEALGSEYKVYTGNRTVSYVYQIYEDTLGAHPNASYRTFTFDTKTGERLDLSDLFTITTNYPGALSNIAKQKLPAIIAEREQISVSDVDTDYLAEGTSPKPQNFQNWYINGRNLVIVFAPYQVGPYALGTIELPIPLDQLILRSEYQ